MPLLPPETLARIAGLRAAAPGLRPRDLAAELGLSEAHLLAAGAGGMAVTRIDPSPGALMPLVPALGEVMALTRNESAVHERRGVYEDWHPGPHAAMVLGAEIDLRIFPSHWVHGFAVVQEGRDGPRRSLQVFDAAGDAIHKIHLREGSDIAAFDRLVAALRLPDQDAPFETAARRPVEPARADPAKAEELRARWQEMTDTHQFLILARRLKMNRLGAYRIAGEPFVRRLDPGAVSAALERCAAGGIPLMVFVGNAGCIQIHGGRIGTVKPMGPWQNVLDPRFNLHLRADHVAEVWLVGKPTRRGPAISVEAFDAEGALILQMFGQRAEAATDTRDWDAMVAELPPAEEVAA